VRLIGTLGVIGIGVLIGAVLGSQHVAGWITGLAVSGVSTVLLAILWGSLVLRRR
jgi:hypothetical protein